jgi:hypothetical protein
MATVDLPAGSTTGDVAAEAGIYADQSSPGRTTPFSDFVILALDANALAPAEGGGFAPEDVARFQSLLAETETVAPLVGPFSGRLVEATVGTVPQAPAGVTITDFGTTATFTNPTDTEAGLWDAGFQFRSQGDVNNRVVVDSLGGVYAIVAGAPSQLLGTASTYDASAGGTNTLQLFVEGDRALFGVNGELAAVVELTAEPVAADVLIGAGFFSEDFVVGRVTDYRDFRVWEIT